MYESVCVRVCERWWDSVANTSCRPSAPPTAASVNESAHAHTHPHTRKATLETIHQLAHLRLLLPHANLQLLHLLVLWQRRVNQIVKSLLRCQLLSVYIAKTGKCKIMTVTLWHYDHHIMTVTLWPSHYDCHIMTMKFLMKTYYFPRTNYDNMSGNCFFWIFITKLH